MAGIIGELTNLRRLLTCYAGLVVKGNMPGTSYVMSFENNADASGTFLFKAGVTANQYVNIFLRNYAAAVIGSITASAVANRMYLGGPGGGSAIACTNANKAEILSGLGPDGGGFKHSRVTTGSIGAGARADVTVTWAHAFADTSYTVQAHVEDTSAAGAGLRVERIRSKVAGSVVVQVMNDSAGALTGTLDVVAIHD